MNNPSHLVLVSRDPLFLLSHLIERSAKNEWFPYVKNGYIYMQRRFSTFVFTPSTAIYFEMTGIESKSNSFWRKEMEDLGFSWWDILELTTSEIPNNGVGRRYRERLLDALGIPDEK